MNIAPIIAGKQNQILRRFRDASATDAEHARSSRELGCRESVVFRGLVARGVLVATGASEPHYYLDSAAAHAFVAGRRRVVFAVMLIALVVVIAVLLTR